MSLSTIRNLKNLATILYVAVAVGLYCLGLHVWPQLKADGIDDLDTVAIAVLSLPAMIPLGAALIYGAWISLIYNPNPSSGHTSYHSGEPI
jgi:hypothetical protein